MATDVHPLRTALTADPAYQAFLLLRTAFTVAPIVFGLDKFTNLLTDWPAYLAPWIDGIVPGHRAAGHVRRRGRRDRWPASSSPWRPASAAGWWRPGSAGSS